MVPSLFLRTWPRSARRWEATVRVAKEEEEEPSSPVLAPFKISLTPTKGGKLGVSVQKQHVEGPARVKLLGGREEGKSFCSSLGGRMAVEIS